MIERAWGKQYTYAMTNLVSCIPLGEDGNKTAEPSDEAIEACTPRLVEFFKLCKPKLVICVGKLSEEWAYSLVDGESYLNVKWASITHPAAILRADISQKALLVQKNVIALADAVEEI
jgi:uracil-DNA glycosylase